MDLNFTAGEMLFYGGIVGMAVVIVVSAVLICVLAKGKKRLRKKFEAETKNIKR